MILCSGLDALRGVAAVAGILFSIDWLIDWLIDWIVTQFWTKKEFIAFVYDRLKNRAKP